MIKYRFSRVVWRADFYSINYRTALQERTSKQGFTYAWFGTSNGQLHISQPAAVRYPLGMYRQTCTLKITV